MNEFLQSAGMVGALLAGGWAVSKLLPTPPPARRTQRPAQPTVNRPAITAQRLPEVTVTVIRGAIEGGNQR